jgi:hypothetical protein
LNNVFSPVTLNASAMRGGAAQTRIRPCRLSRRIRHRTSRTQAAAVDELDAAKMRMMYGPLRNQIVDVFLQRRRLGALHESGRGKVSTVISPAR